MSPTNTLSGGNSPSASSKDSGTDSDTDFIQHQRHAQQQLSHSDTEDTTEQNQSSPMRDRDQKQVVSESSMWEMPASGSTRSESVLSQMD